MSPDSPGSKELNDATWPGDDDAGWPEDTAEEPDPDWPDDWPGDEPAMRPWPGAAPPPGAGGGGPGRGGLRPLALAVVAVVALVAGGAVALVVTKGLGSTGSPTATPSSSPPVAAPSGGDGVGGSGPFGNSGQGATGEAFIAGPVEAVSPTSVTIGGPGRAMTAAVTSATKITGKVASIGAVKVGDQVSAQITVSGSGQATVTALQDPAQVPSSGTVP
jgi:hypothetical protein